MYAINAYSGGWVLVETIAICRKREQAEALLMDNGYLAQSRPGLTIVIEEIHNW